MSILKLNKLLSLNKAKTLQYLYDQKLVNSIICDSIVFNVKRWKTDKKIILSQIKKKFKNTNLIIRSSSNTEDTIATSMAGAFLSISGVSIKNEKSLKFAIQKVIKSYKKVSKFQSDYDEILVQKFITNVSMSGVVFTHEIRSGAPYYVINYDDKTGLTDSITSGISKTDKTIYVYRNGTKNFKSPRFSSLIKAIKKLKNIL